MGIVDPYPGKCATCGVAGRNQLRADRQEQATQTLTSESRAIYSSFRARVGRGLFFGRTDHAKPFVKVHSPAVAFIKNGSTPDEIRVVL